MLKNVNLQKRYFYSYAQARWFVHVASLPCGREARPNNNRWKNTYVSKLFFSVSSSSVLRGRLASLWGHRCRPGILLGLLLDPRRSCRDHFGDSLFRPGSPLGAPASFWDHFWSPGGPVVIAFRTSAARLVCDVAGIVNAVGEYTDRFDSSLWCDCELLVSNPACSCAHFTFVDV